MPSFLWLAVCLALPLSIMFLYSFGRRETYGEVEFGFSLLNYWRSFDTVYVLIYLRSLLLAAMTTLVCLVLAFPVAYFIAVQRSSAIKNLLLFLVTLPFWTSFLIRTYAWIIILRTEGLLNTLLLELGLIDAPLNLLYNSFAILVGLVYTELPFMILPLYAVLERMERSLLDVAADLGCPPRQTIFRVLLPLCKPGISVGAILVFIPSLGTFITPDLLGGAKTMMVGNLIQSQFAVVRDQPFGSAIAFLLSVVVLIVLGISYKTARRSAEVRIL